MKRARVSCCPRQRGAAALAVILLLLLAVLIAVAFAHRSLLFEHTAAHNQFRAAQASEAAEAGIDWALAQLNSGVALDDRCLAASAAGAAAFGERFLSGPDAQGRWSVRRDAVTGRTLQASCTLSPQGFSCRCAEGTPDGTGTGPGPQQGFSVRFEASDAPEQVLLLATGCSGWKADCATDASVHAHSRVTLARLPALTIPPNAALSIRGSLSLPDAPFELSHRARDSGGITLRAGGAVAAPQLALHSVPGAPAWSSVIAHDGALAGLAATDFFTALFGMSALQWQQQPDVRRVECSSPCDAAVQQALGARAEHPRLWLQGGLHLSAPQTLGSAQSPVLLVVDGPIRFDASVQVHGLVHGRSSQWADFSAAQIHGAVSIETDLSGQGASRISHDAAVLKRLRERSGTWARLPGSWRDFE